MSFAVFADGSANLPGSMLAGISLLPCTYTAGDQVITYHGNVDAFNGKEYYDTLRSGAVIKTSLLNTQLFLDHFGPVLKSGQDVIYISMSSGISGTYQAATIAAGELLEEYPDRTLRIIDSHGCGFGSGLLAYHGAQLSREGYSAKEAADILDGEVPHMCQYFTVDDLNFLKRTGRISGASAMIGSVLNIKPLLYGTTDGHIVACAKCRGRKKAIEAMVEKYREKAVDPQHRVVCISHGDCEKDALLLAEKIRAVAEPGQLVICQHEPFSGAHVGPGMLALFFYGTER